MSWEKPIVGGAVSRYYPKHSGTATEPTSAIVAWIIDILEEEFPSIENFSGSSPIYYSWFHGREPSDAINVPSVALSMRAGEQETLGIMINGDNGVEIPGSLMRSELELVILADSTRQREDISSRIFKILNKRIHLFKDNPIYSFRRMSAGDDRGFSTIDRFVMSSLWQNMTEDVFFKIDHYELQYTEVYVDESDNNAWGMVGSFETSNSNEELEFSSVTHITAQFKIVPSF